MTRIFTRFGSFSRGLVVVLAAGALLGAPPIPPGASAAEAGRSPRAEKPRFPGFGKFRVVRIDSDGVFPKKLRVEKGATVIWFNATPGYSSVVFSAGDEMARATRSPTLFFLAPDGAYVSAAFDSGATASVAFVRAGVYRYFVTGVPAEEGAAFAEVMVR